MPLAKLGGDEIWQVALAKLREEGKDYVSVPLSQVTWYHHNHIPMFREDENEWWDEVMHMILDFIIREIRAIRGLFYCVFRR